MPVSLEKLVIKITPKNTVIIWPAVLKYAGEAELAFIADQAAWDHDADLHSASYVADDMLIDSQGFIHSLTSTKESPIRLEATTRSLSLPEVIALIKEHLSEQGSCCVSKFYAPSIQQAITMIGA